MADIPGIIEGANKGKGLGHRFLRHIERNTCLLFLIPINSNDIMHDYNVLLNELKKYNPDLLNKDRLLVITKSDLLHVEEQKKISLSISLDHVFISAITKKGLDKLKDTIWQFLIKM